MSNAFKQGDTVYSIHGQEALFLAPAAMGYAVQPVYEYEDREPCYGNVETWDQVFAEPPTAKLHAQVAELEQKVEGKRQELRKLEDDIRTVTTERRQLDARLKEYQALAYLDDVLAGRMTHAVTQDYTGYELDDLSQALDQKDKYDRKFKLLSLFGDTNGDLQWQINRYRDGSGSWTYIWLFSSAEAAKQFIADRLTEEWGTPEKPHNSLHRLIDSAEKLGLPVPAWVTDLQHERMRSYHAKNVSDMEEKLAAERQKLADLTK